MTKNKIQSVLKKLTAMMISGSILTITTSALAATPAFAATPYLDIGTLDIRPLKDNDWFVEYLERGEKSQQLFQVSNFSAETRTISLYTTDLTKNENKNFFVKKPDQISDEVAPWIQLPTNQITLLAGESQILSANFITPNNAGVGLHQGAIIARENRIDPNAPYQNIAIEKGIRVYLTIKGPAIIQSEITNANFSTSPKTFQSGITIKNTGTVDLKQTYQLALNNLYGEETFKTEATSRITPETQKTINLTAPKPTFGLYTVELYIKDPVTQRTIQTQNVGNTLYIPFSALVIALAFSLATSYVLAMRKRKVCISVKSANILKHELTDELNFAYQSLRQAFQSPQVQRAAIYTGVLAITGLIVYNIAGVNSEDIKTQLVKPTNICKYDLTIKWGNFRELNLPKNAHGNWQGRLYFPNARIETIELLDAERNDKIEITGNKTSINFTASTGPDNDGVIITLIPLTDDPIRVKYSNYKTDTDYEFLVADYLNNPGILPDGKYATYIESKLCNEELTKQTKIAQLETPETKEFAGTGNLNATPDAKPTTRKIPELENLFTKELPATPEILADVILDSAYVTKVVEQNRTKKVEINNILMKALSATPDIIAEISATPDLNYIYLPSETITFPPLSFSFTESKNTAQSLGTMIFVQNKGTTWNTYISTTDFKSLSSTATIPASNIEINPGDPELLGSFIVKEVKDKPTDQTPNPDPNPTPEPGPNPGPNPTTDPNPNPGPNSTTDPDPSPNPEIDPITTPDPEPTPILEPNSTNAGADFSGKKSFMQTTNAENLELTENFTVEARAYLQNPDDYVIVQKGNETGFQLTNDKKDGWQAELHLEDGSNPVVIWTEGKPKLKQWYHLAMTHDGQTLTLYVDGKQAGFTNAVGKIQNNDEQITIGSNNGEDQQISGQIDEVRIWNRTLTETELMISMTQSSIHALSQQPDLAAYWPLNESEGEIAHDKSPNKFDATAQDITWTDPADNFPVIAKAVNPQRYKNISPKFTPLIPSIPTYAATINESVALDSASFNSLITSGNIHKFEDEFDSASLIVADPSPGKKLIFLLRPTIKVEIPSNTIPGTYQGSLTITSL